MQAENTVNQSDEINWHEYNYPPLIKLIHFRPGELQQDRKPLVLQLFAIHIVVLLNTLLSFIDNCVLVHIMSGIRILYAFLFILIFNPIVAFMFYRGYIGLCKQKSKLSLYFYIQPLVIIAEITISIVDFLGFNGFVQVSYLFKIGQAGPGVFSVLISIIYLLVALWSAYVYFRLFRERSVLTKALL